MVFCAFTWAPRSRSRSATSEWPLEHAAWSGVEPSLEFRSTSAVDPRKYEAMAEQPLDVPALLESRRPSTISLCPQSAAW